MTLRRLLVGTAALTVLGSAMWDFGHPPVQVAFAEPTHAAGYCEPEAASTDTANPNASASERAHSTSAAEMDPSHPETEANGANCPADMVEVSGDFCQIVEQICEEYISEKRDRCAKYRNTVRCYGKTRPLHFCIDRYEYPNRAGVKPTVAATWDEARETCAMEGKRLCTNDEWTQACEGPEHTPYAYGYVRNSDACNHDKPYIIPDDNAYQNPATRAAEVERVNQSEPSGSRASCTSAYGVFDMTGNVDEWVLHEAGSENGPEYQSGLKGGYWGPVRNRCRPTTTDHNHWHHGYQIGFRCCADTSSNAAAVSLPPKKVDAPEHNAAAAPSTDSLLSRS